MFSTSWRISWVILVICHLSACTGQTPALTATRIISFTKPARAETTTPHVPTAPSSTVAPTKQAVSTPIPVVRNDAMMTPVATAKAVLKAATPTAPVPMRVTPTTRARKEPTSDAALFPEQFDLHGPPFPAAMQNFENGFMLWRSDLNCVYAIRDFGSGDLRAINFAIRELNHPSTPRIYGYCFRADRPGISDASATPPAGKFVPGGALGKVWNSDDGIRQSLGYATAPELSYMASYPPDSPPPANPYYVPQITLPNGKMLACVFDYPYTFCEWQ